MRDPRLLFDLGFPQISVTFRGQCLAFGGDGRIVGEWSTMTPEVAGRAAWRCGCMADLEFTDFVSSLWDGGPGLLRVRHLVEICDRHVRPVTAHLLGRVA